MRFSSMIVLTGLCLAMGCQSFERTEAPPDASQHIVPVLRPVTELSRLPVPSNSYVRLASHSQPTINGPVQPPEDLSSPIDLDAGQAALTLSDLEEMALVSNPSLSRAAARIEALRGEWVQVGLWRNPTIGYIGSEMGNEGKAGQQGAYVSQEFVRGGKLCLNRAVVAQKIARAQQEWAAARQRVLTDVRIAYYDVLISQRKVEATTQLVQLSEKALEASNTLLKAQDISRIQLLQADVESQKAKILARQANNRNTAAWQRLNAVLGRPDRQPQTLMGSIDVTEQDILWDDALQRVISESPEVSVALAEVERSRQALFRASVQAVPNINVQANVQYDAATEDTITSVQFGLPLPVFDRNQGRVHQAHAEITEAERNIQRVQLNLQQRLAATYNRYSDARFQVNSYSQDILRKAQETLNLVTEGYQEGEVDYITFLTAQRTYFQTNLAYIDSLRELWTAIAEIDGLLLKDSLEESQANG